MVDNYRTSRCLFCRYFAKLSISDATAVRNAGLPMVRSQVKSNKFIFVDMGNSEQVLGHLFIKSLLKHLVLVSLTHRSRTVSQL